MNQFATITEFNTYLSDKLRNVKLNEYASKIENNILKENLIPHFDKYNFVV